MIVVYFILKDIEQMYKKSIILTQYWLRWWLKQIQFLPRFRWPSSTWWDTGRGECWRFSPVATTVASVPTFSSAGRRYWDLGQFWNSRKMCCWQVHGLLHHPGVRAEQSDRSDVLGQFLPGPQLRPGQSGAGRDHRPHSKDGASQYN